MAASAAPAANASVAPGVPEQPVVESHGSLFDALALPGLVGIPVIILLGILAAQVAVGAAWLPVIRRWLNRRV